MATIAKVLGQHNSVAGVAHKIYTAATAGGSFGRMFINNPSAGANPVAIVKVEVRVAGGATDPKGFILDIAVARGVPPNPTPDAFSIGNTDEVWVTADVDDVAFNLMGYTL